jgi:ABC-2 type transport system ATP-binding protein
MSTADLTGPDQQPPETEPDPGALPLVNGRGLLAGAGPHRVFGGLDLEVPAGALAVVLGPRGSGKSLLLLALTGRGSQLIGTLEVTGLDAIGQARRLRAVTSVARIGTLIDLEPRHTVADAIDERAAIDGLSRSTAADSYGRLAALLDLRVQPDDLIGTLDGYHQALLAVILASLRPSELVVLDDVDRGLPVADQRRLFAALVRLITATGTGIVASTTEPETIPDDAVPVQLPPAGTPAQHGR